MPNYCINKNPQDTVAGEHEVHNLDENCTHLPLPENRKDLGRHRDCHSAIEKAKEYYDVVDGCYYCCKDCHTR